MRSQVEHFSLQLVKKTAALGVFLSLWQLVVSQNLMTPLMFGNLPSPLEVLAAINQAFQNQEFYFHILSSMARVGTGVVLALGLGIPLGLIISLSRLGRDFLFPLFELFRPIPQIAWIPTAILLFPTVEASIVYITFIGAFFPILINTISGVKSIPPVLITVANCLGATRWQLVFKVVLPGALPGIFTGLTVWSRSFLDGSYCG
ncbi:MAG: sulfonate transport system permease protein [Clostridia bacterium]|nr:sulfonate transport system permease protein [Clostridia bacterium]